MPTSVTYKLVKMPSPKRKTPAKGGKKQAKKGKKPAKKRTSQPMVVMPARKAKAAAKKRAPVRHSAAKAGNAAQNVRVKGPVLVKFADVGVREHNLREKETAVEHDNQMLTNLVTSLLTASADRPEHKIVQMPETEKGSQTSGQWMTFIQKM